MRINQSTNQQYLFSAIFAISAVNITIKRNCVVALSFLQMKFVHLVAKYFFTSSAGCSENCLKFKMPKVPKIEVFCPSRASGSNDWVERSILFELRMLSYFSINKSYAYQILKCVRAYK
jgi:hypothetical protein